MVALKVKVMRYISDDPQPGIVECEFVDAGGRRWSVVEKTAIVSRQHLDANTSYPVQGIVACEIVRRATDKKGREVVTINTERPWLVESVDGVTQFEVLADCLVGM